MQEVGHDVGGNFAVGAEEDLVDVEEAHLLAVVEPGDDFVDLAEGGQLLGVSVGRLRGKTASRSTLVLGQRARISRTMSWMAAAMSAGESSLLLLVPIMSTVTLGLRPVSSPCCRRQSTCCVRSPPMP